MKSVAILFAKNLMSFNSGMSGDQSEWSGPAAHLMPSNIGRYGHILSAEIMDHFVTASYPIFGIPRR